MTLVQRKSQALVDLLRRYDRHELSEDAAGALVAEHARDFSGDDFFFLLTEEPQVALVVLRDLREVSSTGRLSSGETASGLTRAHAGILLVEAERIYACLTADDDLGFDDGGAYDDDDSLRDDNVCDPSPALCTGPEAGTRTTPMCAHAPPKVSP